VIDEYDTLGTRLFEGFCKLFMALTLNDVMRVAHLARIAVNEEEARATHTQLTGIFDLIAKMQSVDVSAIEPMSHAQDVVQRLRDDVVTEADQRDRFQAVAPQIEAGLYLVPKVIE
jgi:aspartyl-tRNA(Asn)/glutamyl-tRNA(Gln) amidotransferase subunit C